MARTIDRRAHAIRRETFVDAGLRLIQLKGYESMSVQDVLDSVDASRGAFYHYFDSKAALLEAVVDRVRVEALSSVAPVLADPDLSAVQKLEGMFGGIARWKMERRELLLSLLQVWMSDDNAIVREKLRGDIVRHVAPSLALIVRQGLEEGTFSATPADEVARVIVALLQSANEAALEMFLARQADRISFEAVERTFASFNDAFERILGAPQGSITFINPAVIREWYS